jgi:ABC-2 type transport system permease protein
VRFSLARLGHNPRFIVFALLMPEGFYVLYAQMYHASRAFAGTTWGAYFMVSMAAFGAIGTTLNVAGTQTDLDRDQGWVRYLRATPLNPAAYVLAQWVTAMTASLGAVILIVATAVAVSHVPVTTGLLAGAGAVWAASVVFAAIGMALAHILDASTIGSAPWWSTSARESSAACGRRWRSCRRSSRPLRRGLPSYRMADMAWQLVAVGPALPVWRGAARAVPGKQLGSRLGTAGTLTGSEPTHADRLRRRDLDQVRHPSPRTLAPPKAPPTSRRLCGTARWGMQRGRRMGRQSAARCQGGRAVAKKMPASATASRAGRAAESGERREISQLTRRSASDTLRMGIKHR